MTQDRGLTISVGDGRVFRDIKSWSIKSAFSKGPDTWRATVYSADLEKLRFLELQPVELLVDGTTQLYGRIETVETGDDGTVVTIGGRDQRGDLEACHVDPSFSIGANEPLGEAMLRLCGPAGITEIDMSGDFARRGALSGRLPGSTRAPLSFEKAKAQEFLPRPEESVWTFCRRLTARFGATVQAGDGFGKLVVAGPNYGQTPLYTIRRTIKGDNNNNIRMSRSLRDFRNAPTYSVIVGKSWKNKGNNAGILTSSGPVYLGTTGTINERVKPDDKRPGSPTDAYRLFFRRSPDARTQAELDLTFNRALAERVNGILHYNVELDGWTDRFLGITWTIDTLVDVHDEVANVFGRLWVHGRELRYDESDGPSTRLECWLPEAFNLNAPGADVQGQRGGGGTLLEPVDYGYVNLGTGAAESGEAETDPENPLGQSARSAEDALGRLEF